MSHRRTVEPATLAADWLQALQYARSISSDDEFEFRKLMEAAVRWTENHLERALITQTWQLTMDGWYDERYLRPSYHNPYRTGLSINVPRPRLQAVTSITYLDENAVWQTLDSSNYVVDAEQEPGRITFEPLTTLPDLKSIPATVKITHTAGYGDTPASVPEDIQLAIWQLATAMFDHRCSTEEAAKMTSVRSLLDHYTMDSPT